MSRHDFVWVAAVGCAVCGGLSCTDERVVEVVVTDTVTVTRPLANPPPDAASGLLGYFEASSKLTTCGNCHIGAQLEWEETAHADAFATLENSGSAQGFCYGCHTVSERGNPLTDASGWNAVEDPAYHDVQCENCHGAGETHVADPGASQPIASLAIPATLDAGCAECHSGDHHPFAEEWAQSAHASVVSFAASREECESCHRGQGALKAWGVNATYLEQDAAEHLPITCGVCHDPHNGDNIGQLRFPVVTASVEEHLCARCHNRRTAPDATSTHGLAPHSPETALLLGEAGWFPPNSEINAGRIVGSHGSTGNPALCATCHVNSFTVTDQVNGDFVFSATGHLFTGLPCVDAQGVPQPGPCAINTTERSFNGCTASGCHATEDAAFGALTAATLEIEDRAADLLNVLLQVDPGLEDADEPIDPATTTFTVAEGALFNFNLANFGAANEGDPPTTESILGGAVHNPFLIRALLVASLQAMEDEYGVTPSPARGSTDWNAQLKEILQRLER